ncbi:unnamed protein product [Chrysoparadoxa australica]
MPRDAKEALLCRSENAVEQKSVFLIPCRHLCLCQPCSQHDGMNRCPICREDIEITQIVYIS